MTTVAQQLAADAARSRQDIRAARDQASEAAALVDALEENIRDGQSVNPADLANARELARIAELGVEAAERRAVQAATEARHRAYEVYAATVAGDRAAADELEARITDVFGRARDVLAELWDLAGERNDLFARTTAARGEVLAIAREHGETGMLPAPAAPRPPAPPAELAALPLDHLLTDKLAEHQFAGGHYASWAGEVDLHLSAAKASFPHLAPPTVHMRLSQIRQAARAKAGAR
ncbi:hypothetical protein [Nonomuraea rhizosphaerae]|uniref:hypothetical protein n=1 Tax=Nonomuraea rhizosphaerae TaxID=2665663 RepID=UPI001C600DAD|nr:hypothetical protein [Nonomuraea rhizosphaerae]